MVRSVYGYEDGNCQRGQVTAVTQIQVVLLKWLPPPLLHSPIYFIGNVCTN